jgi:hypothetical protein
VPLAIQELLIQDAISYPAVFIQQFGCPKVAQLRAGIKGVPGRKRHRIRHLEFYNPQLQARFNKLSSY